MSTAASASALDHALPLPQPTHMTQPFWDAAREGRLIVQRCDDCGRLRFYPSAGCNHCGSSRFRWDRMSGEGRVYSWIVVRTSVDAAWRCRTPFVTAIVELAEQPGLLMPGLLIGIRPGAVRADLPVEVWFEPMNDRISLPRWRPRETRD
jgi:uncharacterized protein